MKKGFLLSLVLLAMGAVFFVTNSASPDTDRDGVGDSVDVCPQIPATNSTDGCPRFFTRKPDPDNVKFMTPRFVIGKDSALTFKQKTDLRFNDKIQAVLYDPKTGTTFSKSNVIKVEN